MNTSDKSSRSPRKPRTRKTANEDNQNQRKHDNYAQKIHNQPDRKKAILALPLLLLLFYFNCDSVSDCVTKRTKKFLCKHAQVENVLCVTICLL